MEKIYQWLCLIYFTEAVNRYFELLQRSYKENLQTPTSKRKKKSQQTQITRRSRVRVSNLLIITEKVNQINELNPLCPSKLAIKLIIILKITFNFSNTFYSDNRK